MVVSDPLNSSMHNVQGESGKPGKIVELEIYQGKARETYVSWISRTTLHGPDWCLSDTVIVLKPVT